MTAEDAVEWAAESRRDDEPAPAAPRNPQNFWWDDGDRAAWMGSAW